MNISPQDAVQLPLHDARIICLCIARASNDNVAVTIDVKINPEEPVEFLSSLGINQPEMRLTFENCWQVKSNFWGYATGIESINTLDIEEVSTLKQRLLSLGFGSRTMTHFRIIGSAGSQLDVLADSISITECKVVSNIQR
jgi:hypothetical protein